MCETERKKERVSSARQRHRYESSWVDDDTWQRLMAIRWQVSFVGPNVSLLGWPVGYLTAHPVQTRGTLLGVLIMGCISF